MHLSTINSINTNKNMGKSQTQQSFKANIITADALSQEFVESQIQKAKEGGRFNKTKYLLNKIKGMHKHTTLLLMARQKNEQDNLYEYSVRNLNNLSEIHYDAVDLNNVLEHIISKDKNYNFWKPLDFINPIQHYRERLKDFEEKKYPLW